MNSVNLASMGPRSEDRGVAGACLASRKNLSSLQWVHGPRTVVSGAGRNDEPAPAVGLQWVHGPRTVVSLWRMRQQLIPDGASMGPRSEDRGVESSLWPIMSGVVG